MATKTLYPIDSTAASSTHLTLQDGGSAPSALRTATGWTVGLSAPTRYARMDSGTKRLATTLLTSPVEPSSGPDNSLGDCFRTAGTLSGTFASGTWDCAWGVQGASRGSDVQDGNLRFRIWRSTDPTGAGATEITTGGGYDSSAYTDLNSGTVQTLTVSPSLAAATLTNEYLFIQVALKLTGAGNNGGSDTMLMRGSGTRVITTDFAAQVALAATDAGTSATTADLTVAAGGGSVALAATDAGTSATTADLSVAQALAVTSSGAGVTSADLSAALSLEATSAGTSTSASALSAAVVLAGASGATERIANGDFEANLTGWASSFGGAAAGTIAQSTAWASKGTGSMLVDATHNATTTSTQIGAVYTTGAMAPDAVVIASAQINVVLAASQGVLLRVQWRDSGGAVIRTDDATAVLVAQTGRATLRYTSLAAPAGTVTAYVRVLAFSNVVNEHVQFYVDEASALVAVPSTDTGALTVAPAGGGPVALDAADAGTSTTTAALSAALGLAGADTGTSTTTAALRVSWGLAGTSTGTSTTTGAFPAPGPVPLAATDTATSTTTGDVLATRGLAAGDSATSTTAGDLRGAWQLAALDVATSTTTAAVTVTPLITAVGALEAALDVAYPTSTDAVLSALEAAFLAAAYPTSTDAAQVVEDDSGILEAVGAATDGGYGTPPYGSGPYGGV